VDLYKEATALRNIDMSRLRMIVAGAAIVGAAVSGELAWLHARSLEAFGVICGGLTPHCGWCVSAVVSGAVAAAALTAEWRARRPVAVPVKAKTSDR